MLSILKQTLRAIKSSGKVVVASKTVGLTRSARRHSSKHGNNSIFKYSYSNKQDRRLNFVTQAEALNTNPRRAIEILDELEAAYLSISPPPEATLLIELYGTKARCLTSLQNFDEALLLLEKISSLDPNWPTLPQLKGDIEYRQGNFISAITSYETALTKIEAKTPDDVANRIYVLSMLGMAYSQTDQSEQAYNAHLAAVELDPDRLTSVLNLAASCYKLGPGYHRQTELLGKRALAMSPNNGKVWLLLALHYTRQGYFEEALNCSKRTEDLKFHPDASVLAELMYFMGNHDEAEKRWLRFENQADRLLLVDFYVKQGRMDDAKKMAEQLIQKDPMHTKNRYYLGATHFTSDIELAARYFQQALDGDPSLLIARDGLASCSFMKGELKESDLQKLEPASTGSTFAFLGMYDKAHEMIEFYLHNGPKSARRALYSRQMQVFDAQEDYVGQFQAYLKFLATSPAPADEAKLMLLNNDAEAALQLVDSILAKNPTDYHTKFTKMDILNELGRAEDSYKLFSPSLSPRFDDRDVIARMAAQLNMPTNQKISLLEELTTNRSGHIGLSLVYLEMGDPRLALKHFDAAMNLKKLSISETDPKHFRNMRLRARIFEAMNDTEGAIREYGKVLAINPKDWRARDRLSALQNKKNSQD